MNKIIVIGNLGRDPEMRYTPDGQSVTTFSLASNHTYTRASGDRHSETEWFNCSTWGRQAEVCNQYLEKGQQVYVEGRLRSRSYEGRDGQSRFSLDIVVSQVHFLDKSGDRKSQSDGAADDQDPDELAKG